MNEMDVVLTRIDNAALGEMYQYPMHEGIDDSLYGVDTTGYLDVEYGALGGPPPRDLVGYIVDLKSKAEVRQ